MKIWRNRSRNAFCLHCKVPIKNGEPCILIETIYYYHGARSCYLHLKCVEDFINELKELKRKSPLKVMVWKIAKEG